MKPLGKYGIGWIILDCCLLAVMFIDILSGRVTIMQEIGFILFSAVGACMFVALFRRKRKASNLIKTNNDVKCDDCKPDGGSPS